MRRTTTNGGRRPLARIGARTRRVPHDDTHSWALLATAALLLAVALGLGDDKAVSWVLGSEPARLSAYENHYLQEVRHLLTIDQTRRAQAAGERR